MVSVKIQRWGNSQGVRIPKHILASLKWQQDERIILNVQDNKLVMEQAPRNRHKNIKELFKDFNPENYRPSELNWGEPVGDELW